MTHFAETHHDETLSRRSAVHPCRTEFQRRPGALLEKAGLRSLAAARARAAPEEGRGKNERHFSHGRRGHGLGGHDLSLAWMVPIPTAAPPGSAAMRSLRESPSSATGPI